MERWARVQVQGQPEVAYRLPFEGWESAVETLRVTVGAPEDQWQALRDADAGLPHGPILTVSEGLPADYAGERVEGMWWV